MRDLLNYILKGVLNSDEFEIEETEDNGRVNFQVKTKPENIGLIIGKGGKMIRAIRNLLKVRATLEKKAVSIDIAE